MPTGGRVMYGIRAGQQEQELEDATLSGSSVVEVEGSQWSSSMRAEPQGVQSTDRVELHLSTKVVAKFESCTFLGLGISPE